MHRSLLPCATALLLAATAAFCADDADREAVVRSLLERSRFLGDVQFSVPLGVWRDYVREAIGGPEALFPAPVGLIAEEGLYHLTLSAERIPTVSVALRLRVFQPGKCPNIPVLPAIWAWDKVSVNGQPAQLATVDRWLRFSPEKPGLYSISAEVRLKEAPTYGASVDLPIPATVQTAVQFDSPDAWEVTVPHIALPLPKGNQAPSQKQRPQAPSGQGETRLLRGTPGQGTHGTVALTQRQHLTITYGPLAITTEKPAVYELRGDLSWNIDVATQQIAANLSVAIIGGSTERLELALPAGAERVAVSGPDVREVQGTTVFLRGKIREHTRLHVAFELPLAKGSIQKLGGLTMRDGRWGGGTLVITNTAGSSELIANSAVGLSELATADVPDSASAIMAGPLALAYEITARDWSVEIDILDLGEFALRESIADLAHYEIAFRDDGAVMCKASYEIRNRTRQFLRMTLPADATLLVTRVNEKPVPLSPVAGEDGAYLLPLVRSMASVKGLVSFPVEVVFVCRAGALDGHGEAVLPLPRVDLPIAYAWCEAYLPQGMEVVRWAGPLKRVERYSSETAVAEMGYGRSVAAEGYRPTEERRKPHLFGLGAKAAKKVPPREPPSEDEIFGKPEEREPVTRGTWLGLRVPWGRAKSAEKAVALEPGIVTAKPEGKPATAEAPPPAKPPGKSETQPAPTNAPSDANKVLLAKNYYRAGRDYYERGDLENATKLLEQTRDLAPSSSEAINAERLLANLKVVQGKGELKSRAEKAAGVEVQRGIAEATRPMEQQQQEFLERGFQAAREGRGKEATAQFKAAEALGQQLVTKGADVREQSARLRTAKEQLAKAQKEDVSKAGALLGRLETLKRSGNVEEALQTANELRSYQAGLSDADKEKLQSTLEDLTLGNVKKEAESAKRRNLEKQLSELAAEVGKYKAQDAQVTIARLGDMDKKTLDWDALEGTISGVEHGLRTGRRGEGEPADLKDLEKKVETLGKVVREHRERVDERGRQPDRPALPTTPQARTDKPVIWSEAQDYFRGEPTQPAEQPQPEGGSTETVTFTYVALLRAEMDEAKKLQESLSEITEAVDREALGDVRKRKPESNVQYHNGKLTVTGSPEAQKRVRDVLVQLEAARGPQVQLGTNIAGQRAQGLVQDLSGLARQGQAPAQQQAGQATQFGLWDVTAAETSQTMAGVPFIQSGDLNSFIYGNYGWALQREAGGRGQARQVAAGSGGAVISVDDLVNKLGLNLGQKVQVGSINLNVDENSANGVGINFQRGNNDVRFAVIDEAQFRTLMQLDARNPKLNVAMDTNERRQDTIVGTDALMANGWVANVQFAGDRRNTIDINDNPIALPHEKYVVISNGDFVTAVRASEMQHWTQQGVAVEFAGVPQEIDVPRVGQVAKFEKTLVSPEDELVIRAVYNWKGDER